MTFQRCTLFTSMLTNDVFTIELIFSWLLICCLLCQGYDFNSFLINNSSWLTLLTYKIFNSKSVTIYGSSINHVDMEGGRGQTNIHSPYFNIGGIHKRRTHAMAGEGGLAKSVRLVDKGEGEGLLIVYKHIFKMSFCYV